MKNAWGPEYATDGNILYLFISRLRRKIEKDPAGARYLITLARLGYRFGIAPVQERSISREPTENDPGLLPLNYQV